MKIYFNEECINHVQKRMGKRIRELATKEKLGAKSDGALTVTTINELQTYYRRVIVNNTYDLKSTYICKMPSKLVYTIVLRQTKDLNTADVQRVHHRGAVLIKKN